MRILKRQIAAIAKTAPRIGRATPRLEVQKTIDNLRAILQLDIKEHMQPCMVIFDEAIQALIHFERHLYSRTLNECTSALAQQVSRVRSEAIALREVINIGQEAPAGVLTRSLVEAIEVAMAIAIDEVFASRFLHEADQNQFWRECIGYGKVYKKVELFLGRSGANSEEAAIHIEHHKALKNALSSNVHSANHLALRSAAVPSLTMPGKFHVGEIGTISAHLPLICLGAASEVFLFVGSCVTLSIKPSPPKALIHSNPGTLFNALLISVHVLKELIVQHEDNLYEKYSAILRGAPA